MLSLFTYLFWPNPANVSYSSPKVMLMIVLCIVLVLASFFLSFWRRRQSNPMTKKLSRSWSTASFWFGFTGLILVVSRVEQIQYMAMRAWWGVWIIIAILYIGFQMKLFRARHYEVAVLTEAEKALKRFRRLKVSF